MIGILQRKVADVTNKYMTAATIIDTTAE